MSRSDLSEAVFYVTVLSNFARGYDKYRRTYSKRAVSESTYPDKFFVLRENELHIGVRKAQRLLTKLGLSDNKLIALRAQVPSASLQKNERNGLGRIWLSDELPVEAVFTVTTVGPEPKLEHLALEDAAADSLCLLRPSLFGFEQLRPRSVAVLPVAKGCQAACPFCFSEASASVEQEQGRLNFDRVEAVLGAARERGAERAVITGGGEPLLLREAELLELIRACKHQFNKVVLITNGHRLAQHDEHQRLENLRALAQAGLSVLNISRHHHDDLTNARLMNLNIKSAAVARTWFAHQHTLPGLNVRFTCVLQSGGVADMPTIDAYVAQAVALGVPEICFKELYVSTSRESAYYRLGANKWSYEHQVPLSLVLEFAARNGLLEVARLPWGAPVFRGTFNGKTISIAAYTEPSLFWERTHAIARSWNLMADGRCLASLEDRQSEISL